MRTSSGVSTTTARQAAGRAVPWRWLPIPTVYTDEVLGPVESPRLALTGWNAAPAAPAALAFITSGLMLVAAGKRLRLEHDDN
jgi:hypothetical protein